MRTANYVSQAESDSNFSHFCADRWPTRMCLRQNKHVKKILPEKEAQVTSWVCLANMRHTVCCFSLRSRDQKEGQGLIEQIRYKAGWKNYSELRGWDETKGDGEKTCDHLCDCTDWIWKRKETEKKKWLNTQAKEWRLHSALNASSWM